MNYKIVIIIFMIGGTGLYLTEIEFPSSKYESDLMLIAFFVSLTITFISLAMMMIKFAHYERILKKKKGQPDKQKAGIMKYLDKDYLRE